LAGILVIELLVIYFFFYLPLTSNLTAETAIKLSLESQVKDEKTRKQSGQNIEDAGKTVPVQMNSEAFLSQLDLKAKDNQVRILQISQEQPVKAGDLESLDINLILEGPKDKVIRFLKELDNESRLVRFTSWQIQPHEDNLKIILKLTIYAMP